MNIYDLFPLRILLTFLILLSQCSDTPSKAQLSQASDVKENVGNAEERVPFSKNDPDWLKIAWQKFISNGEYRIAEKSAFHIPKSSVRDRYAEMDIDDAISKPYGMRDINNDGYFPDLVVIIEKIGSTDLSRFSLIIFNAPTNDKTSPPPIWLIKNKDLSSTILGWWSGGLVLREHLADGTIKGCYVNWSKSKATYFCEENFNQVKD